MNGPNEPDKLHDNVEEESELLAKELGYPWRPHAPSFNRGRQGSVTAAIIADIGESYPSELQVFVVLEEHTVLVCIRQELPSTIPGVARIREYLTPFTPITYRPKTPEDGATAVRNALKAQLGLADRACAALRRVVEET